MHAAHCREVTCGGAILAKYSIHIAGSWTSLTLPGVSVPTLAPMSCIALPTSRGSSLVLKLCMQKHIIQ